MSHLLLSSIGNSLQVLGAVLAKFSPIGGEGIGDLCPQAILTWPIDVLIMRFYSKKDILLLGQANVFFLQENVVFVGEGTHAILEALARSHSRHFGSACPLTPLLWTTGYCSFEGIAYFTVTVYKYYTRSTQGSTAYSRHPLDCRKPECSLC